MDNHHTIFFIDLCMNNNHTLIPVYQLMCHPKRITRILFSVSSLVYLSLIKNNTLYYRFASFNKDIIMLKAIDDITSSNYYRQLYLLSLGFMDDISSDDGSKSEQVISVASKYKEKRRYGLLVDTCQVYYHFQIGRKRGTGRGEEQLVTNHQNPHRYKGIFSIKQNLHIKNYNMRALVAYKSQYAHQRAGKGSVVPLTLRQARRVRKREHAKEKQHNTGATDRNKKT